MTASTPRRSANHRTGRLRMILISAATTLVFAYAARAAADDQPAGQEARPRVGAGLAVSDLQTSPFIAGSLPITPSFALGAALAFRTSGSILDSGTLHGDLHLGRGWGLTAEGGTYSYLGSSPTGNPRTAYAAVLAAGVLLEFPLSESVLFFTRRPWFRAPMGNIGWQFADFNDQVFTLNVGGDTTAWSAGFPLGAMLTLSPELAAAFRTGFRTIHVRPATSSNGVPFALDAILHLTHALDMVLDVSLPAVGNAGTTTQFSVLFQTPVATGTGAFAPLFGHVEGARPRALEGVPIIDRPLVLPKRDFRVYAAYDGAYIQSTSAGQGQTDNFLLAAFDAGIAPRLELGAVVGVRLDASDQRVERVGGRSRFELARDLALRLEGTVYAYQTSPLVDSHRGFAAGAGLVWIAPLEFSGVSLSIGRLISAPPIPGATSGSSIALTDLLATIDAGGPAGTDVTLGVPLSLTVQPTRRMTLAARGGYRYQSIAITPSVRVGRHSVPVGLDAAFTIAAVDIIGTFDCVPRLAKSAAPEGRLYEGRLGAQWTF